MIVTAVTNRLSFVLQHGFALIRLFKLPPHDGGGILSKTSVSGQTFGETNGNSRHS